MIKTKQDLKRYLEADRIALGINRRHPRIIGDIIWKYQIRYRKTEYYINTSGKSLFHRIRGRIAKYYWKYRCRKWGNEIPVNCIEEGLHLWHGQNIIINPNARIGKYAEISTGVIIGQTHGVCPVIEDNVNFSVDCKVLGGIHVAHDVVIGAGAVVVKDIDTPYSTWGGVPAKCLCKYEPEEWDSRQ